MPSELIGGGSEEFNLTNPNELKQVKATRVGKLYTEEEVDAIIEEALQYGIYATPENVRLNDPQLFGFIWDDEKDDWVKPKTAGVLISKNKKDVE